MLKQPVSNLPHRRPVRSTPAALAVAVYCFTAGQLAADAESLPNEIIVCPWGTTQTRQGPVTVNAETVRVFAAEQAKRRWDDLALDYQHNTVCPYRPGTPEHDRWLSFEPRDVASFNTAEARTNVGIVFLTKRVTESGKTAFKNYQDLSPAVVRNADGVVIALHSAGLCRAGEMNGLTLYAASQIPLGADGNVRGTFSIPNKSMTLQIISKMLKKLGVTVPVNASEETIMALAAEQADQADQAEAETPAEDPQVAQLAALLEKMDGKITALTAELATQKQGDAAATVAQQRAALVAQATAAGKVIPLSADKINATPVEVLAEMVAMLSSTVPLAHKVSTPSGEAVTALSAEDIRVAEKMGVSKEVLEAWHKKQPTTQTA